MYSLMTLQNSLKMLIGTFENKRNKTSLQADASNKKRDVFYRDSNV